jgi:hypothetical protein
MLCQVGSLFSVECEVRLAVEVELEERQVTSVYLKG